MSPATTSRLSRLSRLFSLFFAIVLFHCMCSQDVSALLVYDHQSLIDIKSETLSLNDERDRTTNFPPHLLDLPVYLRHLPAAVPCKKRFRRREKRSGFLVRFKVYMASTCVTCHYHGYYVPAARGLQKTRGRCCPWFAGRLRSRPADVAVSPHAVSGPQRGCGFFAPSPVLSCCAFGR